MLLPGLIALGPSPAWGQTAAPLEQAATPEERLEMAVRTYLSGELAEARNQLVVLVHDDDVQDPVLLEEARVWLGEVHYILGDTAAAEAVFRTALYANPQLRIDTFDHPPEVVAFFDSVKAQLGRLPGPVEPPPTVTPRGPGFIHYALPGGLQYYNQQPGWGTVTLASVALSGAGTLGINLYLRQFDEQPNERGTQILGHQGREPVDEIKRLQTLRAVQWSLAATGLVGWGAGMAVGTVQRPRSELTLTMSSNAVGFQVRW